MALFGFFRCGLKICRNPTMEGVLLTQLSGNSSPVVASQICLRYNHTGEREIVYEGPLTKQIKSVKLFSLITSITGVAAQPVIFERASELGTSTPVLVGVCSVVGFFTFITPLLLHFVTKKYVMSITHDPKDDSYAATVYTLFLREKEILFRPGEAVIPDVLGMFTSMTVRGIPLFIDARFFSDIQHYKKIMGYDKPIDFKFGATEKSNISRSQ